MNSESTTFNRREVITGQHILDYLRSEGVDVPDEARVYVFAPSSKDLKLDITDANPVVVEWAE